MLRHRLSCIGITALVLAMGVILTPRAAHAACSGGAPNGQLQAGEQCDEGTLPNDCCTDQCAFVVQGTFCDDFNDCSKSTRCDGSGECGGGSSQAGTCRKRDADTGDPVNCITYTCVNKACDASQPVEDLCDLDDNPCTEAVCLDPAEDLCDPVEPPLPAGAPCDSDNDACSVEECSALGACAFQNYINCPDSDPLDCTAHLCDVQSGSCITEDEPKSKTCTSDNNSCTEDECNARGDCKHFKLSAGTPCDDNNICTGGEQCDGNKVCGGGVYAGAPVNQGAACNDTNICTNSFCQSGTCAATSCRVGSCPQCSTTCNTTLPSCGCVNGSGN